MIRIAGPQDFDECKRLLEQLGSSERIGQRQLYLNDATNGFTLVVENDDKLIGLSTFTIRKFHQNSEIHSLLYWENLVVDKINRDGLAYLSILGYVRKLLRRKEFDDIYFVARRKNALKTHKAARFKTIGYFLLSIESVKINQKSKIKDDLLCIDYTEFSEHFPVSDIEKFNSVNEYNGFECSSNFEIQRWLSGKDGTIALDEFNKKIFFLRNIFRNFLLEVNILMPGAYNDSLPNISGLHSSLFVVNLKFTRCVNKQDTMPWYLPRLTYEAVCLNGRKSLSSFEIWEHDAW